MRPAHFILCTYEIYISCIYEIYISEHFCRLYREKLKASKINGQFIEAISRIIGERKEHGKIAQKNSNKVFHPRFSIAFCDASWDLCAWFEFHSPSRCYLTFSHLSLSPLLFLSSDTFTIFSSTPSNYPTLDQWYPLFLFHANLGHFSKKASGGINLRQSHAWTFRRSLTTELDDVLHPNFR